MSFTTRDTPPSSSFLSDYFNFHPDYNQSAKLNTVPAIFSGDFVDICEHSRYNFSLFPLIFSSSQLAKLVV